MTLSFPPPTASTILAIPADEPERLFRMKESIKSDYRALMKLYHPDIYKESDAERVFHHIGALYHAAWNKIDAGMWHPPGMLEVSSYDGKKFVRIIYRRKLPFELGTMYVGQRLVSFVIDRKHEDHVISSLKCIGTVRYPSEDFRQSLEHYFPKVEHHIENDNYIVICMRKDPTEVLLSDLVRHMGGTLSWLHTAWIMSSLFNLLSFLAAINHMTINGLTENTIFVSPNRHTAAIYGGWWYAAKEGSALKFLPPETFKLASRRLIAEKRARHSLDIESVRAIGRYCLGDRSGSSLLMTEDMPKVIASFLMAPSRHKPIDEYELWIDALSRAGPRKFVNLDINFDDVYPKEKDT